MTVEHIENLKKGKWVVIFGKITDPIAPAYEYTQYASEYRPIYSGMPLVILAIQIPYILCRDVYGNNSVLDTRITRLISCNNQYVNAFLDMASPLPEDEVPNKKTLPPKKQKASK